MIFALIKDGIVVNKIIAESQAIADAVCAVVHAEHLVIRVDLMDPVPDIGWLYDGTNFSAP